MNKKEVKKAPILRFKGFTNDWEQRKLKEVVNINPSTNVPNTFNYVDLNSVKGVSLIKVKKINKKEAPSRAQRVAKNGDIFYQMVRPYQKNNYLFNKPKTSFPYVFSTGYAQLRSIKTSPSYIFPLLQKSDFVNKVLAHSTGTSYPAINSRDLGQIKIYLPNELVEQNKIGEIFQKINKIIELQQRKLELLKASKKAVLQNIFTDTKRVPTIRFNTFSEYWNQKRLKPFLIKYNKKTTANNQYPVLTSSRQGLFFQKDYYDGNQIASKNNIGYNIVPRNYFTYRHMSDDLIFHFNINTICDYGIVSTLYPVFTTTSEIDSQWLLYYLNHSVDIKKYALLQKQGGSRTYMYFSKLESLKAHIPALAEQKKISSLIFKIDEQIYFQQKKLKYLQKSKRFLLQNMFI